MMNDRSWITRRLDDRLALTVEFQVGVVGFLDFAYSNKDFVDNGKIRCPCSKCENMRFLPREDVQLHLYKRGFQRGYTWWYSHGEKKRPMMGKSSKLTEGEHLGSNTHQHSRKRSMVFDPVRPHFIRENNSNEDSSRKKPNQDAQNSCDLFKSKHFQEASTRNSNNHASCEEIVAPTYTNSRTNLDSRCRSLEQELQRPLTQLELFELTHKRTKREGKFITEKAKEISEKHHGSMSKKYNPNLELHFETDPSVYSNTSGGARKGRLVSDFISTSCGSYSSTAQNVVGNQEIAKMKERIQELQIWSATQDKDLQVLQKDVQVLQMRLARQDEKIQELWTTLARLKELPSKISRQVNVEVN